MCIRVYRVLYYRYLEITKINNNRFFYQIVDYILYALFSINKLDVFFSLLVYRFNFRNEYLRECKLEFNARLSENSRSLLSSQERDNNRILQFSKII